MIAVVGTARNEATTRLVADWRSLGLDTELVAGRDVAGRVHEGDVVLGRLDIVPTLDGVEPGLLALLLLERRGLRTLNRAKPLLTVHDKLRTARLLHAAGVPHPPTAHLRAPGVPPFAGPYVVKPRFGSWGRDVALCRDEQELIARLEAVSARPWFRRHGSIVQQVVPNAGRDLRVVLAAGHVVGAGERRAAAGEWRTNVSCGGTLRPVELDDDAAALARTAASLVDVDLVGVDLMPALDGGLVVLELNGAVEFDDACAVGGRSVAAAAAEALGLRARGAPVTASG